MSKNLITIISFFILLIFFINGFSATYRAHTMTNLAYVLAIGIDVGENAKLKVSAQFSKSGIFSSGSSSNDSDDSIVLVSDEANSIVSCINLLNAYIGKELNLAHCSLIVFSEDIARQGISEEIYTLMNNEEIRPSTNIVISKCDAYDYIGNIKPNLEKLTVQYYDTFSITNKFTGYFPDITLGNFFNTVSCDHCNSTAILGGLNLTSREKKSNDSSSSEDSSSSSDSSNNEDNSTIDQNVITNSENLVAGSSTIRGNRGTENLGVAVFKDDKMYGELTAIETICHLLIQNSLKSCIITIDSPINNSDSKCELSISPVKDSKSVVSIDNDVPQIYLNFYLVADILTLNKDTNYESEEILNLFSEKATEYMNKKFYEYLNKMSKEYNTDIDNFSHKALTNFSTLSEWNNFNWNEKFKNANFHVDIDLNVVSTLLLTET